MIQLVRQIYELPADFIPGPTARMTQMLCLGEIRLAKPQFPLGYPRGSHVRYRADKFYFARWVLYGMGHRVDVLHRPLRHQQSILMFEVLAFIGRAFNDRLNGRTIFRMRALNDQFDRRFGRSIISKDSKALVCPEYFSARYIPSEAPGLVQPLRFGQVHVGMSQR